jgi:hypothetical protein
MDSLAEPGGVQRVRATFGIGITLAGLTAGLTLLFLGMRSVMEIGGYCAEGGPFVIAQRCPKGVPAIMMLSIWGGLIFAALYLWQCTKNKVPSLILFAWPALFLSLGWNFLEFGLSPPGGGTAWGWLVCAVVFILMGGLPLLAIVGPVMRNLRTPGPGPTELAQPLAGVRKTVAPRARGKVRDVTADLPDDLVEALERLATLHRQGELSDDEYRVAKARLLSGAR